MDEKVKEYNSKGDERIKEKWLERVIQEVEKTHKLHGYYFWRN